MIHFASCSTMNVRESELSVFLERTGVEAVSGYTTDVDWVASMAFELMYLGCVLEQTGKHYLRAEKMRICRDQMANSQYTRELAKKLGFRMAVRGD